MKIINKKLLREFEVVETFDAGIALTGAEVKSIRSGGLRLDGAHIAFLEDGPHLIGAEVSKYRFADDENYDPKRSRKVLLGSKEILKIKGRLNSGRGLTVVPVSCYNKNALLKLEIALVRGLKEQGKRKYDKQKSVKRDEKRRAKDYMRG